MPNPEIRQRGVYHSDFGIRVPGNVLLPDRLKPYLYTIERTQFGEAAFASGHFAEAIDLKLLLALYIEHNPGIDPAQAERTVSHLIDAAGMPVRHHSPPVSDERPMSVVVEESAAEGALLLRHVMEQRGLNQIGFIKIASAFLPLGMSDPVLERAGLPTNIHKREYRIACAGWVAAFIDALTDPELYGQDGVILSLEPLGALIQPLHFREQLAVAAIYGDANIAMYVNPKYYRPLAWRIRFIDDGGATKLATRYSHVGTVDQEMVERLHIEFGEGGREIASVSPEAITSAIRRPEGDTNATMDPNATVQFLSDKTPDVHLDILEDLLAINPAASLAHIIIHDPSKLVNTLMNKAIAAKAGLRRKLPQAFLAGLPRPKFMLDTMRMANGSSATTPSKMQHMAVNNLIHPHGIGELVAPGIGAVIAAITYMYQ